MSSNPLQSERPETARIVRSEGRTKKVTGGRFKRSYVLWTFQRATQSQRPGLDWRARALKAGFIEELIGGD
jgi:hypothetical protein